MSSGDTLLKQGIMTLIRKQADQEGGKEKDGQEGRQEAFEENEIQSSDQSIQDWRRRNMELSARFALVTINMVCFLDGFI